MVDPTTKSIWGNKLPSETTEISTAYTQRGPVRYARITGREEGRLVFDPTKK